MCIAFVTFYCLSFLFKLVQVESKTYDEKDEEGQKLVEKAALPETDSLWHMTMSKPHRHLIKHPGNLTILKFGESFYFNQFWPKIPISIASFTVLQSEGYLYCVFNIASINIDPDMILYNNVISWLIKCGYSICSHHFIPASKVAPNLRLFQP